MGSRPLEKKSVEIDFEQTYFNWASLIAQLIKNPAMQEILVRFLGWEDHLVMYVNMLKIQTYFKSKQKLK